jgi:hypothetical protein
MSVLSCWARRLFRADCSSRVRSPGAAGRWSSGRARHQRSRPAERSGIAYLAISLPSTMSARHWPLAWAGLDTAMAVGLAATGWLALRRDRRIAFCAASTATVLVMDAWFDVCTAPAGQPFAFALMDMCVELGEAAACLVLAWLVWRDLPDRFQRLR